MWASIVKRLKGTCAAALVMLLMVSLVACGNKGELYLDSQEPLTLPVNTIDDALDELEAMEAEEDEDS